MKRNLACMVFLLLILCLYGTCFAGEDNFIIYPGRGAGPVRIGKPIPQSFMDTMGSPTSYTAPSPGRDGVDTGSYFWEGRMIVKLNDGKADNNVFSIFIIDNRYQTKEGIKIGSTFDQVKKTYPGGSKEEGFDCDFVWRMKGIDFMFDENIVTWIGVFDENYQINQ